MNKRKDILGLIGFLALCLVASGVGGAVTASSVGTWYPTLQKPPFNPPDWVFAPVWTTLYLFMAVSGWRIWRRLGFRLNETALKLFALQLALNLAWSFVFFGFQQIALALVEICLLLIAIIVTAILFWRIDRIAGVLFLPYILWVAFATVLNASLWLLN